jgi:hypothetical protein
MGWVVPKTLQGGMVSLVGGTAEPPHGFLVFAPGFESGGNDKLCCGIIGFGFGEDRVYFIGNEVSGELPANYRFQRVKRGFFLEHGASLEQSVFGYDVRVSAGVARRAWNLKFRKAT